MPRPKTGTIQRSADGTELKARITVTDNLGRTRRPWIDLDPRTKDDDARAIALAISKEAHGQPWDPERFKRTKELSKSPTVEDYVQKVWFPSRVGKIKSLSSDRSRWKHHLSPLIGHHKLHAVTQEHLRIVVEELDDKAASNAGVDGRDFGEKTAVNCWAVVTAMFRDACASKRKDLRVLKVNPTRDVLPPDGPGDIEKQWLFPSELRQLLECEAVALYRRWVYAVAVYLFCRPGEVLALLWGASIDLQHGMARINRAWNSEKKRFNEYTKTGDTRHFAIEPVLRPLLAEIQAQANEGAVLVFPNRFTLARQLRADLWTAGVRREALHVKRKGARMMRFHDLRATGITYLALRGDSDHMVRDRAGHTDFKTTLEYIRRGQHAAGATMGDPFAPLPPQLFKKRDVESSECSVSGDDGLGENGRDLARSSGDGLP
jgi:integrase